MRLSREFILTNEHVPNGDFSGGVWIGNKPLFGDIDIDNDSVMTPSFQFLIDLSAATSGIEGRQASMFAGYKVHSISVGIRPVDDSFDNDESAFFAGRVAWYPVTEHAKKMTSLMRQVEKATEDSQIDADSFLLSTETDYRGMRYGWNGQDQVQHQTDENIDGYGDFGTQWELHSLREVYNAQTAVPQTNALFDGRAPSYCSASWVAALASGIGEGDSPPHGGNTADHHLPINCEVLGGLIYGNVAFSSGNETGTHDDDYDVHITVNWTPEVSKW